MAKIPTEADFGIDETPEEQEIAARPIVAERDDNGDDEGEDLQVAVVKDGDDKPDARKTREHGADGKFLKKDDDTPQARPDARPQAGMTDVRALQEARAENKVMAERMAILLDTLQKREAREAKAAEPQKPTAPELNNDPLGHIDFRLNEMAERLGGIEGESKAQREQRETYERETNEITQVQQYARPILQQAMQEQPDIGPLYQSLYQSMAREIAFNNGIGDNATPEQQAWVKRETDKLEAAHIRAAVSRNEDVIGYMRRFATMRGVVAPQQQAQQPGNGQQPNGNGQRSIADRQAAQSRHQSIGDLPGNAAPSKIGVKDIARMSNDEFAAFAKGMSDKELDAMFLKA